MVGHSCYAAVTCTHSANCADDPRDFPGAALGPVIDMPVVVQRGAQIVCPGRRHLCRGADADPFGPSVQKIIEILQLQFIDKVVDVCCAGPAVFVCSRGGDSRAPTVAPFCTDTGVAHARRCATTAAGWFRRQKTAKVPQLQYFLTWSMSLLCRFVWVRPVLGPCR